MLRERHAHGCAAERFLDRIRREQQLDHLPVALMLVVPVVEDPEEPVLEGQHAGMVGVGRHPSMDGGRLGGHAAKPLFVVASRIERAAGEVQIVAISKSLQILGLRGSVHHRPVGPTQENITAFKHRGGGNRTVRLSGTALFFLDPDDDHRNESIREGLL